MPGHAEKGDYFGAVLAQPHQSGTVVLTIGVPNEDVGSLEVRLRCGRPGHLRGEPAWPAPAWCGPAQACPAASTRGTRVRCQRRRPARRHPGDRDPRSGRQRSQQRRRRRGPHAERLVQERHAEHQWSSRKLGVQRRVRHSPGLRLRHPRRRGLHGRGRGSGRGHERGQERRRRHTHRQRLGVRLPRVLDAEDQRSGQQRPARQGHLRWSAASLSYDEEQRDVGVLAGAPGSKTTSSGKYYNANASGLTVGKSGLYFATQA